MNALLPLVGGAAAQAVAAMRDVAHTAAQPFIDVLGALADDSQAPRESGDDAALLERVGDKLEEILAAVGFPAGESVAVRYDRSSSAVHVDHGPLSAAAESAIGADGALLAALEQLAATDAGDGDALELLVPIL